MRLGFTIFSYSTDIKDIRSVKVINLLPMILKTKVFHSCFFLTYMLKQTNCNTILDLGRTNQTYPLACLWRAELR